MSASSYNIDPGPLQLSSGSVFMFSCYPIGGSPSAADLISVASAVNATSGTLSVPITSFTMEADGSSPTFAIAIPTNFIGTAVFTFGSGGNSNTLGLPIIPSTLTLIINAPGTVTATNIYASVSDWQQRLDQRQLSQLTSDDDSGGLWQDNAQVLLNDAASELQTWLNNRIALTITAPIFTRIVCAWASRALYARRSDMPAEVEAEAKWADDWCDKFRRGIVNVPNAARNHIALTQSDSHCRGSITNGLYLFPSKGRPSNLVYPNQLGLGD